jgi:ERCC4-related helicase
MKDKGDTFSQIVLGVDSKENTLLFLTPYYDKSQVSLILIRYFLKNQPEQKIGIILPDTDIFNEYYTKLSAEKEEVFQLTTFNSSDSEDSRREKYSKNNIIIITPHLLRNDIFRKFISPNQFSLLIVDQSHLAKGKHAIVKLLEIFHQNNIMVRTIGYTSQSLSKVEDIVEICKNLLITKIEVYENFSPRAAYENAKTKEQSIIVPLNKPIYDFCFEINRYIREYTEFLKSKGIIKPITVRKNFPQFISDVRSKFEQDEQQIIIRKTIELINFQILKDLIEASGTKAAIRYMENLQARVVKTEEAEYIKNLHVNFVRTPIFTEFLEELNQISEKTNHPKFSRLKQLVHQLKMKRNFSKFQVIASNKAVLASLPAYFDEIGMQSKIVSSSRKKEKERVIDDFKNGKIQVLISSKILSIKSDALIFFNNPIKYATFVERVASESEVYILLTHRSNEERVYHNFRNREKNFKNKLNDPRIHQILVQNQQQIFKKNMDKKMDVRTRAMVNVVSVLAKKRKEKKEIRKEVEQNLEELKYIQFLTKCSIEEAKLIFNENPEIEKLKPDLSTQKLLKNIFSEGKADHFFSNIKGRKELVST